MKYDSPGESDTESLPDIEPIHKWSVSFKREIIDTSCIRQIHIYDFDNTLFKSPLPNAEIWDVNTMNQLKDARNINNSSWWQYPEFLRQCGKGYEIEKTENWNGLWIEDILDNATLSCNDPSVLSILLTGRKELYFKSLILEMLSAKNLQFDCVILKKGENRNTLKYKLQVFSDFITTYDSIEKLVLYDDRVDQVRGFQKYFLQLKPKFKYELHSVQPVTSTLEPEREIKIVKQWMRSHNHNFKRHKIRRLGLLKIHKNRKSVRNIYRKA